VQLRKEDKQHLSDSDSFDSLHPMNEWLYAPKNFCFIDPVPAPGGVAVFGVLWDVPALVLSVTDGRPATDEHAVSNARNENV
jgi:hypothetical protein